jgi:DNA-binding MarR family transcriptional regulator
MSETASYELVSLIKRLAALLHQNIDLRLKPYGLARTQYIVLRNLSESGSLPMSELLVKLQVEPATLSGIIDALETKGFVERVEDKVDKRRKDVQLTVKGRTLVESIPPPGPVVEKVLRENVNPDDVHILRAVGQQMLSNLESELKKHGGM